MPLDPLTEVEDISRVVQRFPAFRNIRLYCEDARLHPCANFMAHQSAVDEAQRGMRLEADGEMRVEVGGVIPAHAQDAAAPGLSCFRPPERRGTGQRPGRKRHTSGEASL